MMWNQKKNGVNGINNLLSKSEMISHNLYAHKFRFCSHRCCKSFVSATKHQKNSISSSNNRMEAHRKWSKKKKISIQTQRWEQSPSTTLEILTWISYNYAHCLPSFECHMDENIWAKLNIRNVFQFHLVIQYVIITFI